MRRNEIFWGALLLIIGSIFLLDNLDLLERLGLPDVNIWGLFWPVILIVLGITVLLGRATGTPRSPEPATIPLDGAREAKITLKHGAGRLTLEAGDPGETLVSGTFTGGLDHSARRSGERLDVQMVVPGGPGFWLPWNWGAAQGIAWNARLHPEIPLDLVLNTGAGESRLDLQDLQVRSVLLETGASSTELTLPAAAGRTRVQIKSGVASVKVRVPEGVAARIHTSGGLSSAEIDTTRFPQSGGIYESPDFESADNRVEVEIEMGVGSIEVS